MAPAEAPNALVGFVETVKPLLPIPALALVVPLLGLFFKKTWRELDLEAHRERQKIVDLGLTDARPAVALVLVALVLTLQEYYGGHSYFEVSLRSKLVAYDLAHGGVLRATKYAELWGYAWWAGTRVGGYLAPLVVWKVFFRGDSVRDFGLRTKGFFEHAWIYGLFLAVVLPAMLVVAKSPDFGSYYPFYKLSSRSWFDFLLWESMYFAQFFALEVFFRGFFVGSLRRSFGSGAIFAMAVPYCMIHYGKPYLEAAGAIIAGIALGSLSMRTKSIWQGFLVHVTVAFLMDWLSLRNRQATPVTWWPEADGFPAYPLAERLARREALAHGVEVGLLAIALVVVAIAVASGVRAWRARRAAADAARLEDETDAPGPAEPEALAAEAAARD